MEFNFSFQTLTALIFIAIHKFIQLWSHSFNPWDRQTTRPSYWNFSKNINESVKLQCGRRDRQGVISSLLCNIRQVIYMYMQQNKIFKINKIKISMKTETTENASSVFVCWRCFSAILFVVVVYVVAAATLVLNNVCENLWGKSSSQAKNGWEWQHVFCFCMEIYGNNKNNSNKIIGNSNETTLQENQQQ